MTRLLLETIYENAWSQGEWRMLADRWVAEATDLTLTENASEADIILVPLTTFDRPYEDCLRGLAASELYRNHADRLLVFDTTDAPLGLFAGIYASLRPQLFSPVRHRTGPYLRSFNEFIAFSPPDAARPELLFSFQGNHTSSPRARIFEQNWSRSDVVIEHTQPFWDKIGSPDVAQFKRGYAETIRKSRFVLCPRGNGASSFRLFETMESGRVPVIIADNWVAPSYVDWSQCAVRVGERDIPALPQICARFEHRWTEMAIQARRAWEDWFSPQGMWRLVQSSAVQIRARRTFPERAYSAGWPLRYGFLAGRRAVVDAKVRLDRVRAGLRTR